MSINYIIEHLYVHLSVTFICIIIIVIRSYNYVISYTVIQYSGTHTYLNYLAFLVILCYNNVSQHTPL